VTDEAQKSTALQASESGARGWFGAGLSGLALVTVSVALVIFFGFLDAIHYTSVINFFTPDSAAAAGTLGLVGGAEGVTLSIVIVSVVFGIQTTSSRYSPRIMGIFTRNPLNALVLSFALASILYTFLVRAEVKSNYVPTWSLAAAVILGLINFAILLPYVGYIFEVMRAETLVSSIMRRARRELRAATNSKKSRHHRAELMTAVAQVTDIAFGSIQLGDVPICVLSIEVLGQLISDGYLPIKKGFRSDWFKVGHTEMPGASDQILAEVNRAGTWFTYTIMSSFVDMIGLTPVHRKEAVHAIAVATRNVGLAAIEIGDKEVAELCVRFFNTYLRAAINQSAPPFASAIMNEYRRYAIGALEWRPDLAIEAAAHLLRYGRHFDEAGMPAIFGAAAEDVADLAIEAQARDPQVTHRLALLMVKNLLDLIPNARPIGLNGLFKGVAKLTFWAMSADQRDVSHILVEGIAAAPPEFVDAALDRMESMQNGLFWEVNERVIAFDWVEQPLRAEIPRLRSALSRAKTSGHTLTIELESALPVTQDLVRPEPNATPAAAPVIAPVRAEPAG
jgi:succinate dehydrogenase hydrophobic anchor subunit